jgi:hypothetical protein
MAETTPPGGNAPQSSFTQDQKDDISAMIGGQVSNMMKAAFKTFMQKDLKDALGPMLGETLKAQLPELVKGLVPAPTVDDPDGKGDKDGKGKNSAAVRELETQLRTAQSRMNELTERLNTTEQQRQQELKANMDIKLRSLTVSKLAAIGITDTERAQIAAGFLIDSKKCVRYDEETGHPLFDDGAQAVDLDQGLRLWSRSNEAKHFLPPAGGHGAGTRPGGNQNGLYPQGATRDQAIANVFGALEKSI